MRTLRNLPVPQDGNNVLFPDGQIRNQTDLVTGTPVVRELYGDVLTNIYAILRDAGITPDELEDNQTKGYQLLNALKVFSNELNDRRQVLTVGGTNINVTFNFDSLPQNYVFIGILSDALDSNENYNLFSGNTGIASYPVILSDSIPASSTVLVIINSAGTSVVNIGGAVNQDTFINTSFGFPLSYNDSSQLYFLSQGRIMTDFPMSYEVQASIESFLSQAILVVDAILFKGKLLCLCLDDVTLTYRIFAFDQSDLNTVEGEVTFSNVQGVDNQPYMYCDGQFVYFTNSVNDVNSSVNNNELSRRAFDEVNLTLNFVSSLTLDSSFVKTTNIFMDSGSQRLFTFTEGVLYAFPLSGTARSQIGFFPTLNGVVFKFNGPTYYSNGNIGTRWNY